MAKISENGFYSNLDENDSSFPILMSTNEKCEWLWPVYMKYGMGGFMLNTTNVSAVSVLICYITNGHFEVDKLYHPFKFV